MTSLKSLYRSASHYLAGNVGVMVLGFISFPLTTRSLSVAQYGDLNVAMRVALLVVIIAKIGLPHSMVRFYAEDAESEDLRQRDTYYSTFVLTACGAAVAACMLYAITVSALPNSVIGAPLRYLLLLTTPFVFANALNSLLTGFLRAAGRSKGFAAVQFAVKVLAIGMMIGLLYLWERSARAIVTSNVLAELSTFAIVIILIARRGLLRFAAYDSAYARKIIAFAAPLVIFEMSSAVLDGGDRLLIKSMLGSTAAGLYSAAYNVSVYVQDLVFASVNQALVPLWIRIWKTEGPAATAAFLSRALNDFVVACCLLCCGTFVCSGDLLLMLAGSQYTEARPLVPIIVVGLVIYTFTTFFNAGLYLNKRTGVMAGVVFTSAATNLILNYIFLPKFGIIAAVYATIVSYTLAMVITAVMSSRYLEIHIEWASILKAILVAAVVSYALTPLDFGRPIVNILLKGILSVIGFVLLLGLINAPLRTRVFDAVRQARAT